MAYDVASSIHKLLFEHETVIIPGFGGFVLNNQSASIDYIKSTIAPPSKIPSFNRNLTLNDGVLSEYIKTQNRCTLEQAQKIVKDFVEELMGKIEAKEIIEFPKVGRLYKDYNKELQFLPYDTNFNTEVFGLPTLEAHPFSRSEAKAKTTIPVGSDLSNSTATIAASTPMVKEVLDKPSEIQTESPAIQEEFVNNDVPSNKKEKPFGIFKWTQMVMPLLVIATIAIIGLSYYLLSGGKTVAQQDADDGSSIAVNDTKKINTSPSIEEAEIITLPEEDSETIDSEISSEGNEEDVVLDENPSNENEEANATYSDEDYSDLSKEAIVIVGQFSKKSNADKYVKKVENDGYESFTGWNDEKEWHMVGVKFTYEKNTDKIRMIKRMKDQYDDAAWLLDE